MSTFPENALEPSPPAGGGDTLLPNQRHDRRRAGERGQRLVESRLHAIAALGLGAIERAVGNVEQRIDAACGVLAECDADAHRRDEVAVRELCRRRLEIAPDAIGYGIGLAQISDRQQRGELLAADAPEQDAVSERRCGGGREGLQHPVTDRMAHAVVDLLEAVEIEQQHGQRLVVSRAKGD